MLGGHENSKEARVAAEQGKEGARGWVMKDHIRPCYRLQMLARGGMLVGGLK